MKYRRSLKQYPKYNVMKLLYTILSYQANFVYQPTRNNYVIIIYIS